MSSAVLGKRNSPSQFPAASRSSPVKRSSSRIAAAAAAAAPAAEEPHRTTPGECAAASCANDPRPISPLPSSSSSSAVAEAIPPRSEIRTRSASASCPVSTASCAPSPAPSLASSASITFRVSSSGKGGGEESEEDREGPADDRHDDSNKENVPPFRDVNASSATASLDDSSPVAARRASRRSSTGRPTAAMERRYSLRSRRSDAGMTDNPPPSHDSDARSAASQVGMRRTRSVSAAMDTVASPSRRGPNKRSAATEESPRTPSKRISVRRSLASPASRSPSVTVPIDEDAMLAADELAPPPTTPMSRMRIRTAAASSHHRLSPAPSVSVSSSASSSMASSDLSSLFDVTSQRSRETSPAATDIDVAEAEADKTDAELRFPNVYAHARALLRYASQTDDEAPGPHSHQLEIVGRETERAEVEDFIRSRLLAAAPVAQQRCLYISGSPGTGKTALVRDVLAKLLPTATFTDIDVEAVMLNCMSFSHPRDVFGALLARMGVTDVAPGTEERRLEEALHEEAGGAKAKRHLVILDEIDHLVRGRAHQKVLYRLFSYASGASFPGFSLIGIANALDLTSRFLPLLAAKGVQPQLLHFGPFESKDITAVVRARLAGLKERYDEPAATTPPIQVGAAQPQPQSTAASVQAPPPIFSAPALELCARKVAAASGDLRKALDAARLAIELVEMEQRKKASVPLHPTAPVPFTTPPRKTTTTSGSQTSANVMPTATATALAHLTPASAPKVSPAHILKVLSSVLGSPNLAKVRGLHLQPKLVLLALLVARRRALAGLPALGAEPSAAVAAANGKGKGKTTAASPDASIELVSVSVVQRTYEGLLRNDGAFEPLESTEFLDVLDLLEVNAVVRTSALSAAASAASGGGTSVSPSKSRLSAASSSSPSKKKLSAAGGDRAVRLDVVEEDVVKGLTSVSAASGSGAGDTASRAVVDVMTRMWSRETDRMERECRKRTEAREARKEGGADVSLPLST